MLNHASKIATKTSLTAQCIATVNATAGVQYQIVALSAGLSSTATVLTLDFGGVTQMTWYAHSTNALSEYYGIDGPVTGDNTNIEFKATHRGGATQAASVNMLYRIVF